MRTSPPRFPRTRESFRKNHCINSRDRDRVIRAVKGSYGCFWYSTAFLAQVIFVIELVLKGCPDPSPLFRSIYRFFAIFIALTICIVRPRTVRLTRYWQKDGEDAYVIGIKEVDAGRAIKHMWHVMSITSHRTNAFECTI